MAPKTTEQFELIRERRKNQIMEAALQLFAIHGFQKTSISQIAIKTGISKGLMYNYFTSKEQLLNDIFEQGLKEMTRLFDPNKDGILTSGEFEYFVHEIFNLMQRKRDFYKLYFAVMMQPAVWNKLEARFNDVVSYALRMLSDYYRSKGNEQPEVEALLVGALFDGIALNYVYNFEVFPLEDIKNLVVKRFV